MATPHVSGSAGLIWSYNPSLSALAVKRLLLGNVDTIPSLTNITVTGGRLNVAKAFAATGPAWLTASPMAGGKVAPNDSAAILVTVNPAGLAAGRWTGRVIVATNDPSHQQLPIDVTADIGGCKSLIASTDSIGFGSLWPGQKDTAQFILSNACNAAVTISNISSTDADFVSLTGWPVSVPPSGTMTAKVVFSPDGPAQHTAFLTITSDAGDHPSITVMLKGTCIRPPAIAVAPANVQAQVARGDTALRSLTITNSGDADLVWSIKHLGGGLRSRETFDTIPGIQDRSFTCLHDLYPTYWNDGGNDAFDGFGYPSVKVGTDSVPVCMLEGDSSYTINGYHLRVRNHFAENHIYRMIVEPQAGETNPRSDITVNLFGNMGSDGSETVRTDSVLIGATWLRFYTNTDNSYPNGDPRVVFMIVPSQSKYRDSVSYWQPSAGYVAMRARNITLPAAVYIIPSYHTINAIKAWLQNELSSSTGWLTLSADTGRTAGGGTSMLQLRFASAGLAQGTYRDTLKISHNAPLSGPIAIPVVMEVTGDNPQPGRSRIISIGPSYNPKIAGALFTIKNLSVGAPVVGGARGSRYSVRLW